MTSFATSLVFASVASLAISTTDTIPTTADPVSGPCGVAPANGVADSARPVLFGEATEGLAMLDYERARELISEDFQSFWMDYSSLRGQGLHAAVALRDSMLEEHAGALAAIRQGAHRENVGSASSMNLSMSSFMGLRWLACLTAMAAERSLDQGDSASAVDHLLDGMQMATDVAEAGGPQVSSWGMSILAITSNEALLPFGGLEGLLTRIPNEQARRLGLNLATLDQRVTDQVANAAQANEWSEFRESAGWVLSNVRLLRMSIEHKVMGSFRPLADPFGGQLEISAVEGRTKLRYRGPEAMWSRTGLVAWIEQ